MTDPHLNAEQLFGFELREGVCAHVCVHACLEWQLSAGGSCRWKAPTSLLSFLLLRHAERLAERFQREEKALTRRNVSPSGRARPAVTQRFFLLALIELCGDEKAVGGRREMSKNCPRSLCPPHHTPASSAQFPRPSSHLEADGNWFLAACRDPNVLRRDDFSVRQR